MVVTFVLRRRVEREEGREGGGSRGRRVEREEGREGGGSRGRTYKVSGLRKDYLVA
jgi:hypothetical protein